MSNDNVSSFVQQGFEVITATMPTIISEVEAETVDEEEVDLSDSSALRREFEGNVTAETDEAEEDTVEHRRFSGPGDQEIMLGVGDVGIMVMKPDTGLRTASLRNEEHEQDDVDQAIMQFVDFHGLEGEWDFAVRVIGRWLEIFEGPNDNIRWSLMQAQESYLQNTEMPDRERSWRQVINATDVDGEAKAKMRSMTGVADEVPWQSTHPRNKDYGKDPAAEAAKDLINGTDTDMADSINGVELMRQILNRMRELDEKIDRLDKSRSNVDLMEEYCGVDT